MKKILLLHMLVFVSATLPISSVASDEVETLKCTIIADAITGNTLYETGECARRVSPCSSFKLPLAIMGFDSGILQSPKSPTWELKPEYNPSPRDRTYKQVYPALWQSDSVVWFSQQLTSRLGVDRFTEYVKKFEYGNQDVSGDSGKHNGLTQSWLMSSLTISPKSKFSFFYALSRISCLYPKRLMTWRMPQSRSTRQPKDGLYMEKAAAAGFGTITAR